MAELDERDGVVRSHLCCEQVDLASRRPEVARQGEHAHEQAPARDVIRVTGEVFLEDANGVGFAMLARERRRALKWRRRAGRATRHPYEREGKDQAQIAASLPHARSITK